MYSSKNVVVARTLLVLGPLLSCSAASAAPQPVGFGPVTTPSFSAHFLSDSFGQPCQTMALHAQSVLEAMPKSVLNNHLERIPRCHFYYDARQPSVIRIHTYPGKRSGPAAHAPKTAPFHKPAR